MSRMMAALMAVRCACGLTGLQALFPEANVRDVTLLLAMAEHEEVGYVKHWAGARLAQGMPARPAAYGTSTPLKGSMPDTTLVLVLVLVLHHAGTCKMMHQQ